MDKKQQIVRVVILTLSVAVAFAACADFGNFSPEDRCPEGDSRCPTTVVQTGDPCNGITFAGVCDGNVLRWCDDALKGAGKELMELDCTPLDLECGLDEDAGIRACLDGSGNGTGGSSSSSSSSGSGASSSSSSSSSSSGTGGSGGALPVRDIMIKWRTNPLDNVSWEPLVNGTSYVHGEYFDGNGTYHNWPENDGMVCVFSVDANGVRSCQFQAQATTPMKFTNFLDGPGNDDHYSFELCPAMGNGDDIGMTEVYIDGELYLVDNDFRPATEGGVLYPNSHPSGCFYNAEFLVP